MIVSLVLAVILHLSTTVRIPAPMSANTWTKANERYYQLVAKGHDKRHILTIVDFSIPENQPRMWIIDKNTNKIIYTTYVAQGYGISNTPNSHASSIGTYLTLDTYQGKNGYSLKLQGLDSTNSNAYSRKILVHGAAYVGPEHYGHSWGCFAVRKNEAKYIINLIKNDTIIYAYGY